MLNQTNTNDTENVYKVLKSSIKASYFSGFEKQEFVQKSRLQIEKSNDNETNVDDKTFRISRDFKRPENNFTAINFCSKCCIEPDRLFACLYKKKFYDLQLSNSKLCLKSHGNISRYVDFNVVSAKVSSKGDGLLISFRDSNASLYIQPAQDKKSQSKRWVQYIQNIIKNTDGLKNQLSYLPLHCGNDFFKTQHILCKQFEECANSLDILLFKSQHSAAAIQRIFTNSQYDHVGVVLRNKKNELLIYQSTSNIGVGFTLWRHVVKFQWYKQTDKQIIDIHRICWRKLNINLTDKDIQIIQQYVAKTLGKDFSINLQKLLKIKSKIQRSSQDQEKKTYFCSQLVARLYKQLGILDSQKSSTSYYPVDFTNKGNLKFVRKNVTLSRQQLISFDQIPKC